MELAFSSVSNVRNKRGIGTNNPMDIKRKTKDYYKQLYAFSVFCVCGEGRWFCRDKQSIQMTKKQNVKYKKHKLNWLSAVASGEKDLRCRGWEQGPFPIVCPFNKLTFESGVLIALAKCVLSDKVIKRC